MITTQVRTAISLHGGCELKECREFAGVLYSQLTSGAYDEMAVMLLPGSMLDWEQEHRTARKRAWRADRLGYRWRPFARARFADAIHQINTSRPVRQGRPMAPAYRECPVFGEDLYPCRLHGVHPYGIFSSDDHLAAYLFVYRACDLALVSQVLGHADHETAGIMYLLFRESLAEEAKLGPGVAVYNRYDSGTDGLRFLKDRLGFRPAEVAWLP